MELKQPPHRRLSIMGKARLEAFSDGVIAIIITLMILEIKLPHFENGETHKDIWQQLLGIMPHIIAYALSFIMLGIYWVNHHHLFNSIEKVDTKLLWYNLHLLFWLSLVPLPTGFIAEHHHLPEATAFYGFILFMCGLSYTLLNAYAVRHKAIKNEIAGSDGIRKYMHLNWIALVLYFISIFAGYINVYISIGIFVLIAIAYFIPFALDSEPNQENGYYN